MDLAAVQLVGLVLHKLFHQELLGLLLVAVHPATGPLFPFLTFRREMILSEGNSEAAERRTHIAQ